MPFRDKVKKGFGRIKERVRGLASGRSSSSSINNPSQSNNPEPVAADPVLPSPVPNEPPAPSTERSTNKPADVRGRLSGQPSATSKHDHGQTSSSQLLGPDAVPPPPGPNEPPVPIPERTTGETAWAGLKTSIGLLQASVSAFGPLKTAVEGFSSCIEIFERAAKSRKDYEMLGGKLNTICLDLSECFKGSISPAMKSSIDSLAKCIERETNFVLGKQERNKLERVAEAMGDPEAVLQCYSRIREHLERLERNVKIDTWKIVNELVTNDRLKSLPDSLDARYRSKNSANLRGEECTENTRADVLTTLRAWAYDDHSERDGQSEDKGKSQEREKGQEDETGKEGENSKGTEASEKAQDSKTNQKIYWLSGMAGTGKTTIANSFCAELKRNGSLAASFFCSRQLKEDSSDVSRIFSSISYQLAQFSPPFRQALSSVLEDPETHNQHLPDQFKQLIAEPLKEVEDIIPKDLIVVIDALDECVDQNGVDRVLETLLSQASNLPIKFFVTSRPESKIRDRMLKPGAKRTRSVLHLHDLERSIVREDIKTYLQVKLEPLNLPAANLERLVEQSGVLFIYASTLVRYIGAHNFSKSAERLKLVLNESTSSSSIKDRTIDELYSTILQAAFDDPDLEDHDKDKMQRVLRTVVCAQEPLTVDVMAGLLGLDATNSVRPALRPLFSVLHVSETSGLVTTLHQSFPDYMFNQGRSGAFYCDILQHNTLLAERCFGLIRTPDPPFNICRLESSYLFDKDVPGLDQRIETAISPELFYACRYLGAHLGLAETSARVVSALREFLSQRLLFWMEVLNLKQCLYVGARGLHQVIAWCQRTSCPADIQQLAQDAWRFVIAFSTSPASRSTPHIYISALAFWPEQRPVSKYYSKNMRLPKATGTGMRRRESAPLAVCVSPGPVMCAAYSPDGTRIVSGSYDKTIRIWDPHSGEMIGQPLQGHTHPVLSVAYSSDGTHIVSGSSDNTIRIWDADSGEMIGQPLQGHTHAVSSVAYSSDGTHIVSCSYDKTIRIWDAHSGEMIGQPLQGHTHPVLSVAYSSDDTRIVSGSYDKTIRIWDAHSGEMIGQPLQGHIDRVLSVAYSSDGTRIVSGSDDNTIRIWDAHSGEMIGQPLQGHTHPVNSVAYSSDGTRIVSGSWDKTIRIWDAHSGEMIGKPLQGHTLPVNSVAYSSDGTRIVSGSSDSTTRIWDAHSGEMISQPLQGHIDRVLSVAYSSDGTRIVSGSDDNTIRVTRPMHMTGDSGKAWVLDGDGYMRADGSKLVMWVPPDVRDTLLRPQNMAIASIRGSVKVDFSDAPIGDSWSQCFQPT